MLCTILYILLMQEEYLNFPAGEYERIIFKFKNTRIFTSGLYVYTYGACSCHGNNSLLASYLQYEVPTS